MPVVKIEVTQDDIEQGDRSCAGRCPVALAMSRAGILHPNVFDKFCFVGDAFHRRSVAMPDEVTAFVRDFDDRKPVQPFAFELVLGD